MVSSLFLNQLHPKRIEENINVFDFKLTDEQMERIDSLNKDQRIGPDPATFEGH